MLWLFIIAYFVITVVFFFEYEKNNMDYEDLTVGTYFVIIGGLVLAVYPLLSGEYGSYGNYDFVGIAAGIVGVLGLIVGLVFYMTEYKDEKELQQSRKNRNFGSSSGSWKSSASSSSFSGGGNVTSSFFNSGNSYKKTASSRHSEGSGSNDDYMTASDSVSWETEQRVAEHDDMISRGHSTVNLESIVNSDGSYDMEAVERNISSMEDDYNPEN